MNNLVCPVPDEQRPINEFNSISNSFIISWPLLDKSIYFKKLIYSWLLILPIILTISGGSIYLRNNTYMLIIISSTGSLILPISLLIRQWLSWKYIFKRLKSINIEYEESGWYDGQIWQKPIEWRTKDLLIAHHEVQPILTDVEELIHLSVFLLLIGLLLSISIINF